MDLKIENRGGNIVIVLGGQEYPATRQDMFSIIAQANTALWTTEPDVVQIRQLDLSKPLPPDIAAELDRRK